MFDSAFSVRCSRVLVSFGALVAGIVALPGCIFVGTREIRYVDPVTHKIVARTHEHDWHEGEPHHVEALIPARLNHIVLMKLNDPGLRDDLVEDCRAMVAEIPGISSVFCGSHVDTGRPTVQTDYDVCLYVGFDDTDAYRTYVEHPAHVGLVDRWLARLTWLKVYDVEDEN